MKEEDSYQNELSEIAPFLSKIKKEENFIVPENYFEFLPNEIQNRISINTKIATRFDVYYKTVIGLATILLFVGVYFLMPKSKITTNETYATIHDIIEYLEYDIDFNFETEYLAAEFYQETIINENQELLHNTEIENYLLYNEVDDLLIEE